MEIVLLRIGCIWDAPNATEEIWIMRFAAIALVMLFCGGALMAAEEGGTTYTGGKSGSAPSNSGISTGSSTVDSKAQDMSKSADDRIRSGRESVQHRTDDATRRVDRDTDKIRGREHDSSTTGRSSAGPRGEKLDSSPGSTSPSGTPSSGGSTGGSAGTSGSGSTGSSY